MLLKVPMLPLWYLAMGCFNIPTLELLSVIKSTNVAIVAPSNGLFQYTNIGNSNLCFIKLNNGGHTTSCTRYSIQHRVPDTVHLHTTSCTRYSFNKCIQHRVPDTVHTTSCTRYSFNKYIPSIQHRVPDTVLTSTYNIVYQIQF